MLKSAHLNPEEEGKNLNKSERQINYFIFNP